jgi:glutathione S-transferase
MGQQRMITVWGEGRGFRVVWLLEELGLRYTLRPVDLLKGVENDPEFLAINPGGFIPAIQDGDVTMVESIAIMEYLLARYGSLSLAPAPNDAMFPRYKQFMLLGEAGLMVPANAVLMNRRFAPENERDNLVSRWALRTFESRLGVVRRQLEVTPFIAGEQFTAADISVTYALTFAQRTGTLTFAEPERAYVARTTERDAYKRAMDSCRDTKAWVTTLAQQSAAHDEH